MSYTHKHLPELSVLKESIERDPSQLSIYAKYGGLIGPNDSINYLTNQLNEYHSRTKS